MSASVFAFDMFVSECVYSRLLVLYFGGEILFGICISVRGQGHTDTHIQPFYTYIRPYTHLDCD
jgi:hypothetical protein